LGELTKKSAAPGPLELRTLGIVALLAGLLVNPGSIGILFAPDGRVESARFLTMIVAGQIALVALGAWLLLREPGALGPALVRRSLGLVLAVAACGGAYGIQLWIQDTPSDDSRPNIVLIVLDTTRRDRLSLYGYGRPTTPNLERLASESTVWEQAYSTSTWTSPSHASLFTGLYPAAHGVTQSAWEMGAELDTLAERLGASGYRTVGIVGNPMVGRRFGFDQGFDEYHETWRDRRGEDRPHAALDHLERAFRAKRGRPLFVFVNLIEPHSPYTSGADHRDAFVRHSELELFNNQWSSFYLGEKTFNERELEHLSDVYDVGLRHVDGVVGAMVDMLRSGGVLDETVVVVTADHGENLGEHEHLDHVFSLYEPTVRIPLLARHPGSFEAGQRVNAPVQLTDVYATLAGLAEIDGGAHVGYDLRGAALPPERPILLSYDYPKQALRAMGEKAEEPVLDLHRRRLWALREGDLKVIVDDAGVVELYDLAEDPGELRDLAADDVERAAKLRERVLALVAEHSVARDVSEPGTELDASTEDELRKLGYLGGDEEEDAAEDVTGVE
jgi:arylsulfatase A-like enzyme